MVMIFNSQHRDNSRSARISMALFRMSQAIKKLTQAESDALGLSPAQIQALLFASHTRNDAATVGNFAKAIGASHVTAVKIMNGLVGKGLVAKVQKADDRRVTLLELTSKGEEVAYQLQHWGQSLETELQQISEEALAHLELGLGAIISAMQGRGHLIVSEPCLGCIHFMPNAEDSDNPHYCKLVQKYISHEASLKECPEHTPFNGN
ncbi:MarR family transcriptional regulator [Paenibacillus sp. IITD108]